VIDLIDVERAHEIRLPIGERVETRAENDVLPRSVLDGLGELILGEPVSHDEEPAQSRIGQGLGRFQELLVARESRETPRKPIGQYLRLRIQQEVDSASHCHTDGCLAGTLPGHGRVFLHALIQ
jgi:hypothetical protein